MVGFTSFPASSHTAKRFHAVDAPETRKTFTRNARDMRRGPDIKKTRSFFPRLRDGICTAARYLWRLLICSPRPSSAFQFSRKNSTTPLLPNHSKELPSDCFPAETEKRAALVVVQRSDASADIAPPACRGPTRLELLLRVVTPAPPDPAQDSVETMAPPARAAVAAASKPGNQEGSADAVATATAKTCFSKVLTIYSFLTLDKRKALHEVYCNAFAKAFSNASAMPLDAAISSAHDAAMEAIQHSLPDSILRPMRKRQIDAAIARSFPAAGGSQ